MEAVSGGVPLANIPMSGYQAKAACLLAGIISGTVISVLPLEFAFCLSVLLIGFAIWLYRRGIRGGVALGIPAAVGTMAVCVLLPVKWWNARVPAIHYENMPLSEVCDRLQLEHGLVCHFLDKDSRSQVISFSTSGPMSRGEVLEKLSRDTGTTVTSPYCGTGSTLLFGPHPMGSYFVRPSDNTPDSQPGTRE